MTVVDRVERVAAVAGRARHSVVTCVIVLGSVFVVGSCSSGNSASPFAPNAQKSSDTTSGAAPTVTTSTIAAATTTSTSTTTTTPPSPTTAPLALTTDGGVVKVANASAVDNAAARLSEELAAFGFTVADATNAAGIDEDLQVSKIYAKAGSEAVAESVRQLVGDVEIFRMPTPAWITGGTAGLGDATVLLMLGEDRARVPLRSMRFEPGRQGPD